MVALQAVTDDDYFESLAEDELQFFRTAAAGLLKSGELCCTSCLMKPTAGLKVKLLSYKVMRGDGEESGDSFLWLVGLGWIMFEYDKLSLQNPGAC
jgi:hypothetical protein